MEEPRKRRCLVSLDRILTLSSSAPGKVLVLGGYTILKKPNPGLVLTTSSRFFVRVRAKRRKDVVQRCTFRVESSQLQEKYEYVYEKGELTCMEGDENHYVFTTLKHCLRLGEEKFPLQVRHCEVALLAHNDFYSQTQTLKSQGLPVSKCS